MDIKKGDTVYVLAGRSRMKRLTPEESAKVPETEKKKVAERHDGRRGQVLRALPAQGKVVVEGANLVIKHNRKGAKGAKGRLAQQQAGRIEQPAPMPVSKVMLVCPRCDKPTRPYREEREGKRVRICRMCKEIIDSVR